MKIIGISGKKKTGKTLVAELISLYLPNTIQWNFADCLKAQVARATGKDIDYINAHKDNFRLILQGWGTDYRRKLCGDDYWVKKWLDGVSTISSHNPSSIIICSDVRFENEIRAVEQLDGEVWRVERFREMVEDNHPSEVQLDKWPFKVTINNTGTKEELAKKVREQLNK